jgi:tetratricopeptide (TPR) repeat protein
MAAAPDDAQITGEAGRLALQLGKYGLAEQTLARRLAQPGASAEVTADLAHAQWGQRAFDRAHATLKAGLEADAGQPVLWRALGELLSAQGRHADAVVFFEESLRLDISSARALDGIAEALLVGAGDAERALEAGEAALEAASPEALPALTASHARRLLAAGRLEAGWTALARLYGPGPAQETEVRLAAPRWTPGGGFSGRLLLIGAEDLVEEVLLTEMVPTLAAAGQPVILALDPRWAALARRSFPDALIVPHQARVHAGRRQLTALLDSPHIHEGELVGCWAPFAEMLGAVRRRPADFAGAGPWLKPDPQRVTQLRERLAALGPGLKVGVAWRPPTPDAARAWEAPPLPALAAALSAPGATLFGVQFEDIQGELAWIRSVTGVDIGDPPDGLQLRDLDEQAAFVSAVDVVVGPPNRATYLAAACGAPTWILSPPAHWLRLGAGVYPWFPQARVIAADAADDWSGALGELHEALRALAAQASQVSGRGQ